eukprot:CAMPEP_0201503230 /NCGR_PEP_ID=MMETSP0151_2-20130828/84553_1 /ASSEMBLY_ACC=CAM_ASM_000257 /TAXON_ID=200890 /ORGANISM="Paramoeba atlantica, Strain 621/1 / CCAP 1560/9" /LENGTH=567 /DNA_ID=CAMNT_0047896875 /DNA_START=1541 /DNA_END=3245 /DNA_ORIENTATION=-
MSPKIESDSTVDVFNDIAALMDDMNQKMSLENCVIREEEIDVFMSFLCGLRRQKEEESDCCKEKLKIINTDLGHLEKLRNKIRKSQCSLEKEKEKKEKCPSSLFSCSSSSSLSSSSSSSSSSSCSTLVSSICLKRSSRSGAEESGCGESLSAKKRRVCDNMEELQQAYFNSRRKGCPSLSKKCRSTTTTKQPSAFSACAEAAMEQFISKHLQPCVSHTNVTPLAVLRHNFTRRGAKEETNDVVRAISFNATDELFAVSGNSQKIEVFQVAEIESLCCQEARKREEEKEMRDVTTKECGTLQNWSSLLLDTEAPVTCLSWNPFVKTQLCSTDSRGGVVLWDIQAQSSLSQHTDHTCGAWSIDFNPIERNVFTSCSDDTTVRIWNLACERSTGCIRAPQSVLSVRWNPILEHQLAFGCADNRAYIYDTRMICGPLSSSLCHRRPVSAVDWLKRDILVTQSNDETLKLWELKECSKIPCEPTRVFRGHSQYSNLVGMATWNDYIATGSEDNSLYVYNRHLSKPSFVQTFNTSLPAEDEGAYVSALGWRRKGNVLIAGNNKGILKVLCIEK